MSFYLVQASYSAAAYGAMVSHPQDRAAAVRPLIEKMGGKLHGIWLSFGEFDVVAIAEMPDAISTAAFAMSVGASGAMGAFRTTPLLTMGEATEAMKKAGGVGYQAPK
jgi:uncharacterized protein with GYD domain